MTARDRGKLPAIALAVALSLALVGTALSDTSTGGDIITTGHTTYLSAATTNSECFAGITGILSQKVSWFNGVNLFSRPVNGDGDTYMYVMEHFNSAGYDSNGDGAPDQPDRDNQTGIKPFDPSNEPVLYETGNEWHIEDPNNAEYSNDKTWIVREYYTLKGNGERPNDAGVNPDGENELVPEDQEKVYIYVVEVGDTRLDQTIQREYNFITTVDTCKFLHGNGTAEHENTNDENPRYPAGQHDPGADEGNHWHGTFRVDLFVGDKPDSIPAPGTDQLENAGTGSDPQGDGGGSS